LKCGSLPFESGKGERIEKLAAPEKIAVGLTERRLSANGVPVFPDAAQLRFDNCDGLVIPYQEVMRGLWAVTVKRMTSISVKLNILPGPDARDQCPVPAAPAHLQIQFPPTPPYRLRHKMKILNELSH